MSDRLPYPNVSTPYPHPARSLRSRVHLSRFAGEVVRRPPTSPAGRGRLRAGGEERVREATLIVQRGAGEGGALTPRQAPASLTRLPSIPASRVRPLPAGGEAPRREGDQRQRFARVRQTSMKLELKLMSGPSGLPFSSSVGALKFFFIVDPPVACEPLVSEACTMRLASTGSMKENTGTPRRPDPC